MFHSDQAWVAALKRKDRTAINLLYNEVFPMVKKLVTGYRGSEEDAWDVFQETMIVLYRKIQDPNFQLTSKLSTFLVGISRLIWMKKSQKDQATMLTHSDSEAYITNDTELIFAERELLFRKKLHMLGEQCRSILLLFFQKTKMEEIARQLNLASAEVARITKYRCTQKLIKLIQSDRLYAELKT